METEIKLNVGERLVAMGILPQQESYATLRVMRELKEKKLGINAEEFKEFEVKETETPEGVRATWGKKGFEERPIKFMDREIEIIKDALLKLDKEKKLENKHYSLYDKFVGEIK